MQSILDLWIFEVWLYFSSALGILRGTFTAAGAFSAVGTLCLLVGLIWAAIVQARGIWWFVFPSLLAFVTPVIFSTAFAAAADLGFFAALFLMLVAEFGLIALAISRAEPKPPAVALSIFALTFTVFGSGLGLIASGQL